jgi:hypothetical protein
MATPPRTKPLRDEGRYRNHKKLREGYAPHLVYRHDDHHLALTNLAILDGTNAELSLQNSVTASEAFRTTTWRCNRGGRLARGRQRQ